MLIFPLYFATLNKYYNNCYLRMTNFCDYLTFSFYGCKKSILGI